MVEMDLCDIKKFPDLEDDFVVQDRLYLDKLFWFYRRTNHQFALLPHRCELAGYHLMPRFFVDGPIDFMAMPEHSGLLNMSPRALLLVEVEFVSISPVILMVTVLAVQIHNAERFSLKVLSTKDLLALWKPLRLIRCYSICRLWSLVGRDRNFLLLEHLYPSFLYARNL